uniref:Uncharacterized protein n=1 Tax=Arundo donax TaxID=35708 RepID=A0A0A9AQP1_ARUDO
MLIPYGLFHFNSISCNPCGTCSGCHLWQHACVTQ